MTKLFFSRFNVWFLLVMLTSCTNPSEELVISDRTDLLLKPYPMEYPSTNQLPNEVIRVIDSDVLPILDDWAEKDFFVYKVSDHDGRVGHIIGSGSTERRLIAKEQTQ